MVDDFPIMHQSAALYQAAAAALYSRSSVQLAESERKGASLKPDTPAFNEMMGGFMGSVVLHAFALELAMKSLCLKRGVSFPRTHNLACLFAALPKDDQETASEGFRQRDPKSELEEFLRANANTFVEWRYQHEYKPATVMSEHLAIAFDQIYKLSK